MKHHSICFIIITFFLLGMNGMPDLAHAEQVKDHYNETDFESFGCAEYQYWKYFSNGSPYPGMFCLSGPGKTIGITVIVARKAGLQQHITPVFYNGTDFTDASAEHTMTDVANRLVDDLNTYFSPHGVAFALREVVYATANSPTAEEMNAGDIRENINSYFDFIYKGSYNPNDLNILFIPRVYGIRSSASHPWNTDQSYGKPRAYSTIHWVNQTYDTMVHEVGHFFGLLHTFWDTSFNSDDFEKRGPNWVTPVPACHREGDYVCDTPFDCHPTEETSGECEMDPSVSANYPYDTMASRVGVPGFSREQGARIRYYLMQRLTTDFNGNTLKELKEYDFPKLKEYDSQVTEPIPHGHVAPPVIRQLLDLDLPL